MPDYKRKPLEILNYGSVLVARALIMGRYGMLQCKANFSNGYAEKNCEVCRKLDNESHRINECIVYQNINLCDSDGLLDYELIYSDNLVEVMKVLRTVLRMWDLGCGKNAMRKE